jgi:hypothetical protein
MGRPGDFKVLIKARVVRDKHVGLALGSTRASPSPQGGIGSSNALRVIIRTKLWAGHYDSSRVGCQDERGR